MCDRPGIVVNWTDERRKKRLFPDPEKKDETGEHEANKRLDESDTDRPDTRYTRKQTDTTIRRNMIRTL